LRAKDAHRRGQTNNTGIVAGGCQLITTHAGKEAVEDVKQETGGDVEMLILDVTSEESIKGVVEAVQEDYLDEIDVLVSRSSFKCFRLMQVM
jgi:NADP-dependent 3-hydroxy acid dehydrogenase YdfG